MTPNHRTDFFIKKPFTETVCLSYMVTYTIHPLKQNFNSGHEDLHGKILNLSQHRRNKILISTEMDRFQWPLILSQI